MTQDSRIHRLSLPTFEDFWTLLAAAGSLMLTVFLAALAIFVP